MRIGSSIWRPGRKADCSGSIARAIAVLKRCARILARVRYRVFNKEMGRIAEGAAASKELSLGIGVMVPWLKPAGQRFKRRMHVNKRARRAAQGRHRV